LAKAADSVFVFYPRGEPALCFLYHALAAHRPVRGVSGAGGLDLLRLALGIDRADPLCPTVLPFAPWGDRWRGVHGTVLGRLAGDARTVVFTRPEQAPLLRWFAAQRKVYHAIDDYTTYRTQVDGEAAIIASSERVVTVSAALANALSVRHGITQNRIAVLPNAVRAAVIPPSCRPDPTALPDGLVLPRPLAGVLGHVSSRLRLGWLASLVDRLPWLHWLFVGDVEIEELIAEDRPTLEWLQNHPRCTFVGARPYGDLERFAACLDLAVLPYAARSANPHGSSMRLFLHLPFGAPILATPGCLQVEEFSSVVTMCSSVDSLGDAIETLRGMNFRDTRASERWELAHHHTWERRAEQLHALLQT
jgi:glycosyltransferase involved in cell wall biosynthesis